MVHLVPKVYLGMQVLDHVLDHRLIIGENKVDYKVVAGGRAGGAHIGIFSAEYL